MLLAIVVTNDVVYRFNSMKFSLKKCWKTAVSSRIDAAATHRLDLTILNPDRRLSSNKDPSILKLVGGGTESLY